MRLFALLDSKRARAKNLQGGGSGDGKSAMRTIDPTVSLHDRSSQEPGPAEYFQRNASSDNVHDGIDGAHFMKVDLLRRLPVNLAFGNCDAPKDGDGFFFDPFGEGTAADEFCYVGKRAPVRMWRMAVSLLFLRMRMPVSVCIVMMVGVRMTLVFVLVLVFVRRVEVNVKLDPLNSRTVLARNVQMILVQSQFLQLMLQ